ncbi:class I adenylate-forming enzyme family protein [Streptomyces sp. NPDC054808]
MVNVFDVVERQAACQPHAVAIRRPQGDLSYAALADEVRRVAGLLSRHGVRPGGRVLLMAPTGLEFILGHFGTQALGATTVPVNTMATAPELEYILSDSGCDLAIHAQAPADALTAAAAAQEVPRLDLGQWATGRGTVPELGAVGRGAEEIAGILYTSGTTGRPKGVMLTVANVLAAGEICAALADGSPDDRFGTALPLFHVFGQSSVMMAAFTLGASLSVQPRFDPSAFLDLVATDELTVVAGVPTMWNAMLHTYGTRTPDDFPHLRIAVSGGAPLPSSIAADFETRFGCELRDGYGLTESTALATFSAAGRRTPGYTGPAVPRTRVEIRDQSGHRCAPGVVGEIHIQGPTVMAGYLGLEKETAAVLDPDGWLRTGDLGEANEAGDICVVDRAKDMIIRGGYNIYPAEVEDALYRHPDIIEAAVLGVPHAHYGEDVAAVVVPRPDSNLSIDDIDRWARQQLSAYKVPRHIELVTALPKSGTGKILKRDIVLARSAAGTPPASAPPTNPERS